MTTWLKRRFEILKRNLTWYEWIVIAVMGPACPVGRFQPCRQILLGTDAPSCRRPTPKIMIYTLLAFTPIVLGRIAYLLFFEKDRHQLPAELDHPNLHFQAFCITTPESITAVNALVRKVFPSTTIPDDVVTEILMKNRNATIGLYQRKGVNGKFASKQELVGCASCWPVEGVVYEQMLASKMNEDQIRSSDVLDNEQAKDARYFYVPVMLVRDWKEEAGRLQAAALLAAFLEGIRTTYVEQASLPTRGRSSSSASHRRAYKWRAGLA